MFNSLDISASALTAQRLRMDVISSNIANADTTRAKLVNGKWQPYRRKIVVMKPLLQNNSFDAHLQSALGSSGNHPAVGEGVQIAQITADPAPFKQVYDPSSPDADAQGYVLEPNVDPLKEMVDMMDASRSYEANVTALNATKSMVMKSLEIGR